MSNIPEWLIRYRNWSIEALEGIIIAKRAVTEAEIDFIGWIALAIALTFLLLMAVLFIISLVSTICESIKIKYDDWRTPIEEDKNNGLEDIHEE